MLEEVSGLFRMFLRIEKDPDIVTGSILILVVIPIITMVCGMKAGKEITIW